jgi:preprotein translocase subunit SecG
VRWRARRDSYSIRRPPVRPPLVLLQQRGGGGGARRVHGGLSTGRVAAAPAGLRYILRDFMFVYSYVWEIAALAVAL